MIHHHTLGGILTHAGLSPLCFCCCDEPIKVGNSGGHQFQERPDRDRSINPFLRVGLRRRIDAHALSDTVSDEQIEREVVTSLTELLRNRDHEFPSYGLNAVDYALAEQFERIDIAARQAIAQNQSIITNELTGSSEEDFALLALIALGLFDENCCH